MPEAPVEILANTGHLLVLEYQSTVNQRILALFGIEATLECALRSLKSQKGAERNPKSEN